MHVHGSTTSQVTTVRMSEPSLNSFPFHNYLWKLKHIEHFSVEHLGHFFTKTSANIFPKEKMKRKLSGHSCPFPGSLSHGKWSCKMQEIQIRGTSFLDEDAQSYMGKIGFKSIHLFSTIRCSRCSYIYIYKLSDFFGSLPIYVYVHKLYEILASVRHP